MSRKPHQYTLFLALVAVVFTPGGSQALAIETADYDVIEVDGDFELRRYAPQILAETTVDSNFDEAGNRAFRRLFNYISGANRTESKIAMTAPVSQEASSRKIAMTAPVIQEESGAAWNVAFLVPASYSWETVPQPTDDSVRLRRVPERTLAALRFSGTWGEKRFRDHEKQLRAILETRGLEATGETIFARYDPPFKPWFLRRNEILIPVAPIE
jgi:hypothetical protein